MSNLLVFREKLIGLYAKFDIFIMAMIKFALVAITFFVLNQNLGYTTVLKSIFLISAISLLASILPFDAISLMMGAVLVYDIFAISKEMALITVLFLLIIALLYYNLGAKDSILIVLVPILFFFKIPYAIPLLVGLGGLFVHIIPVSFGVIVYYIILYVKNNAGALTNTASIDITQRYMQILNGLLSNKIMYLMLLSFIVTILIIIILRKLSMDYVRYIAMAGGVIALFVSMLIGEFIFRVNPEALELVIGIFISLLIAIVYNFFIFAVDYSNTEYLNFEDDEYVYYVKAVPKINISTPDVKVERFGVRRKVKENQRR